ncbi:SDR family NAD(P)-dependent oxidoreductase [Lyngbya aestuarii]|uniref:SDR family NAD(P)-dependent oxidoreductase n=1 Tax=Lyngbya aestuarii TaxID=118322 RepID=UPI00403DAC32
MAVQVNVTKKAEVERLFAKMEQAFGKLDILVNNAGIYEYLPPTQPGSLGKRGTSRVVFADLYQTAFEVIRSERT